LQPKPRNIYSNKLFLSASRPGVEWRSNRIICAAAGEVPSTTRLEMVTASPHQVTQLLQAWSEGDQAALDQLMPLVYQELHRLAHRYLGREQRGHTLQTTALVNEAYLRLIEAQQVRWQDRAHFFAISAQLMRRILVDFARARGYRKRGGGAQQVSLDEGLVISPARGADFLALDEALKSLAAIDERKSRVIELRYFGGLSVEETAEVLKVSPETVKRDWRLARTWLLRELSTANSDDT
jgi:RNA polymerase sigma factor (TIGR02999 family)